MANGWDDLDGKVLFIKVFHVDGLKIVAGIDKDGEKYIFDATPEDGQVTEDVEIGD